MAVRTLPLVLAIAMPLAHAQTGNNGDPAAPTPPPTAAETPAAPSAAGNAQLAPVQITGSRPDDVQERRNSTAAKIVIGREEIDRFGDSTLGEVLKRLPGVTIQGRPGRGGAIRMRGLGRGYTQILLDGERVAAGFSLDSISPEQIERIEVLRAPTAETGARAIAGTINIVTRGGTSRSVNDLRLSLGLEDSGLQPGVSWTRNFATGPFTVNYSLSAYHYRHAYRSTTTTTDLRLDDGTVTLAQRDDGRIRVSGEGAHGTARLQWRSEGGADTVTLIPLFLGSRTRTLGTSTLTQSIGTSPAPYGDARTEGRSSTTLARLNGDWTHRFAGGARLEARAGIGRSRAPGDSLRTETTGAAVTRTLADDSDTRDTSLTASGKFALTTLAEHSLVTGVEVESNRRDDSRVTVQAPVPIVSGFGDDVKASSLRLAAYMQDDWRLNSQWSAHAGLRWEGIRTRGSVAAGAPDASNRSDVVSPLLHAVWKPDPKGRDQVRFSLTRSYRSPTLANLIARPSYNTRYPITGPNLPTQPDRAGNPDLKPELATGIDIALERYLPGSGLLSANYFRRHITDYLRSETRLETVPYASVPRYVLRVQNVGDAVTQGLELEAKFRASDLWPGAPRVNVRANASVFDSKVKGVPGPDNRLDQQPDYTANVGADYRLPGVPLTLGANLNWTPGYATRLSDVQTASVGAKLGIDGYALVVVSPRLQVRLSVSNLAARDYRFGSGVDGPDLQSVAVRESSRTTQPTFVKAQVRLEMKL